MQQSNAKVPQQLVQSFLEVVKEKKLGSLLPEVTEKIYQIHKKEQEEQKAIVYSAVELPKNVMERIGDLIKKQSGKSAKLVNKLNPDTLAGFRVEYQGWVLDTTIKHDLESLEKNIFS